MSKLTAWIAIGTALALAGCNGNAESSKPDKAVKGAEPSKELMAPKGSVSKLGIEDVKVGTGPAAAPGDLVVMGYSGKLANGLEFDSSKKPGGGPYTFTLGAGSVIKGWDEGLVGMKVGGKRKLSIPYSLAYGDRPMGDKIPAKSDLFFDVELLDLVKKGDEGIVDNILSKEKPGKGPKVKKGDTVSIIYSGTLANGKVFDTNDKEGGKPLTYKVGNAEVIPGLDSAVIGMQKGGFRHVKLPPLTGFPMGQQGIPPNSVIYFDIKVVDVKPGAGK